MTDAITLPVVSFRVIAPAAILAVTGFVLMLLDLLPPRGRREHMAFVGLAGVVIALVSTVLLWGSDVTGFQGLAGPRGTADNLKKLTGVSGAIEKKFNDLGIFHYWQLAELDHDTAHKIGEEVGLPSRADGWVAQAKALTAEAE